MWSLPSNSFLCMLFLSAIIGYGADDIDGDEQKQEEADNELDLSVFEQNFDRLNTDLEKIEPQYARSLLSKLGKIALYFRLYRTSISSPTTGNDNAMARRHHGFDSFFPQPPVQFHRDLYLSCSGPKFNDCVDAIFASIQPRAMFMFPLKDQQTADFLRLDIDDFARRVSNSKFSFDMSVSYLLCFFTKRRLIVLERLPFCSYGIESQQIKLWPAGPFRQFGDSPEISNEKSEHQLDPIDTFLNQRAFECADVSFCPDPCCGRKSLRFFRADDISNSSDSPNTFGFCGHSACSMNVKHLNEKTVAEHFKRKVKKEEKKEKVAENDEEAATVQMPSETERHEGDRNNDEEQGDSVVNTHYCYLESPFNDDLVGIMQNRWNLSCACASANGSIDSSKIYRFDVLQCVDLDECLYENCPAGQHCLNMNEGKMCACPFGSYKNQAGDCVRVDVSSSEIRGVLGRPN